MNKMKFNLNTIKRAMQTQSKNPKDNVKRHFSKFEQTAKHSV